MPNDNNPSSDSEYSSPFIPSTDTQKDDSIPTSPILPSANQPYSSPATTPPAPPTPPSMPQTKDTEATETEEETNPNTPPPPHPDKLETTSSPDQISQPKTEKDATGPSLTPAQKPASSPRSLTTIFLLILTIVAVAGAVYLYIRSQNLSSRLQEITSTQEGQLTTTPLPQPSREPVELPQASPTVNPSTPVSPVAVFGHLDSVLDMANQYHTNNQLLMITADNLNRPQDFLAKYWFRKTSDTGISYFYILYQPGLDLELVDQQVYVTPDNDIPDLKIQFEANQLGLDLDQAMSLIQTQVLNNANLVSSPDSIIAQYIETNLNGQEDVLLWQLVYRYLNQTTPVVVQINAQTQEIIYTNVNYNIPSPTTTP